LKQQHVGVGVQALERCEAIGMAQVERDAALVAVERQVHRSHAFATAGTDVPDSVSFGRLDLDDVGSQVRQDLRREGAHHHAGEVHDPDARQGAGASCALRISRRYVLDAGGLK
jgi:hypothetical protein